jgi:hypothetical protein
MSFTRGQNDMKKWELQPGVLISPDGDWFKLSPISKESAESQRHAIHAKTAQERAVIVLRMLIGEREWSDGWERPFDDCFEMNDGDEVVRHIVEIANAFPEIKQLICRHRSVGESCFANWEKSAKPVN